VDSKFANHENCLSALLSLACTADLETQVLTPRFVRAECSVSAILRIVAPFRSSTGLAQHSGEPPRVVCGRRGSALCAGTVSRRAGHRAAAACVADFPVPERVCAAAPVCNARTHMRSVALSNPRVAFTVARQQGLLPQVCVGLGVCVVPISESVHRC
jgi:hypothetical protein